MIQNLLTYVFYPLLSLLATLYLWGIFNELRSICHQLQNLNRKK